MRGGRVSRDGPLCELGAKQRLNEITEADLVCVRFVLSYYTSDHFLKNMCFKRGTPTGQGRFWKGKYFSEWKGWGKILYIDKI